MALLHIVNTRRSQSIGQVAVSRQVPTTLGHMILIVRFAPGVEHIIELKELPSRATSQEGYSCDDRRYLEPHTRREAQRHAEHTKHGEARRVSGEQEVP